MSASKFRDVTNGTVNSKDDLKKQKNKTNQQCFLVQLLKIKFIVGWGEAFFLKKEKGV